METESFFEARTCYENGLQLCSDQTAEVDRAVFGERIDTANRKLAELNLLEAECAYARGDVKKAVDHLELVKTLTYDPELREKAEKLRYNFSSPDDAHEEPVAISSCASCAGSSGGGGGDSPSYDDSLPLSEYYELLIQQLPDDQYRRYVGLGEKFAYAYVAASRDEHHDALSGFESCSETVPCDIFLYEKGKVLHRLGNDREAEQCLRTAIQQNAANSLAWLTLALVQRESNCFEDALTTAETMITEQILPEQAQLLRADIFEATGNHEGAVNQYVELLQTPYARTAAERLHGVLLEIGRERDAAVIFKKYMHKSCH